MSWLDEHSIVNPTGHASDDRNADDNSAYDSVPIEREFVLAPAWRAFKARMGSAFRKSEPVAHMEEEFPSEAHITEPEPEPVRKQETSEPDSSVSDTHSYTHRIEPEQPVIAQSYRPEPTQPAFETPTAFAGHQPEAAFTQHFEPMAEQDLRSSQADDFESAPIKNNIQPTPADESREEVFRAELQPIDFHDYQPSIAQDIQPVASSSVRYANDFDREQNIAPEYPVETAPLALAGETLSDPSQTANVAVAQSHQAARTSTVVSAAVKLDSWISGTKAGFANWKKSVSSQRSHEPQQQKLFANSTPSTRDRLWAQTSIAAAAIALAFLMGWTAANSRNPALSPDQSATDNERISNVGAASKAPASKAKSGGVTLAPTASGGVTLAPGSATAQSSGVTLLPNVPPAAVAPVPNPIVTVSKKRSPMRPAAHHHLGSASRSRNHLRRSIDGPDNEVVVRHYPAKTAVTQNTKQTAQLKKYSDTN